MAFRDPSERNVIRMQVARFVMQCESQASLIERADSLREVSRVASIPLSYPLSDEQGARDAQRQLQLRAEDRARELILDQIKALERADPSARGGLRHAMQETWANLTGPLGHLRGWALKKLSAAEANTGPL